MTRRAALQTTGLVAAGAALGGARTPAPRHPVRALPAFFEDLERRTFAYFWETTNRANGLVPDRWPTPSFSSIAAIGWGLAACALAAERGWITRAAARERVLTTLRFLIALPQGEGTTGFAGHRGFFYHFLDMDSGLRHGQCELSTVDTSLLFMGVLFAAGWFDRADPAEAEIRTLAHDLTERAEWDWFQRPDLAIPMGWHPETGFIDRNWDGYNEGKLVYILALGATRHGAKDGSWSAWTRPYPRFWRGSGAARRLAFAPLFGHQYSEAWIDFRGIHDAPMRAAGFDYFENSRRATLAQHAYAVANPMGWHGYDNLIWGLTACDGPGDFELRLDEHDARFRGYSARGPISEPDGFDDGTIAPTAMLGSLPFAPELSIPGTLAMRKRYGAALYGRYGFRDSFNPSFTFTDRKPETGTVDPRLGWTATDWLGLDQGPILVQLANHRSDAVWRVMRRSPTIVRGLRRAGFSGGWLDRA